MSRVEKIRLLQLMKFAEIPAQRAYKHRQQYHLSAPATIVPNLISSEFTVDKPNQAWVTDIKYEKTAAGLLFLAIVLDLFSQYDIG
jgi:putative transposase